MTDGVPILVAGVLLALALAASLTAERLRAPALVLFLAIGMAIGSDGAGWLRFDNYTIARDVGSIALALILFEGGLNSGFGQLRTVLRPAISLAFLGTVVTALVGGLAAAALLDVSLLQGLLLGSILASTDSAAIFALMRDTSLRRRLSRTLEGESGLNDPVAVLLVLGFIEWIQRPDWGPLEMSGLFLRELLIGAVCGIVAGWLAVQAFERVRLPTPGLYPVLSVATAALAFGAATSLHGSGFLAVYLAGLLVSDAPIPARQTVALFHQGGAWLAQISLFVILGLLVSPGQMLGVAAEGTILAIVVVVVARPLATFVATLPDRFSVPEQVVLSWAGMRGGVPVVLATLPVIAGVARGQTLFNLVFFAVVISTLAQGTTFETLARRLRVTTNEPARPRPLTDSGTIRRLGAEIVEYPVSPVDSIVGRQVRHLGLFPGTSLNVVVRDGVAIPPNGATRIRAGDRLHLLVRSDLTPRVNQLVGSWEEGWPRAQ